MKYKTNQREVCRSYSKVISVNYCGLQHLLSCLNPAAYTASNQYGWRSDIYEASNGVAISTGYSPLGNVKPDYETVLSFERRAQEICNKFNHEERKPKLDLLLSEFLEFVLNGGAH